MVGTAVAGDRSTAAGIAPCRRTAATLAQSDRPGSLNRSATAGDGAALWRSRDGGICRRGFVDDIKRFAHHKKLVKYVVWTPPLTTAESRNGAAALAAMATPTCALCWSKLPRPSYAAPTMRWLSGEGSFGLA